MCVHFSCSLIGFSFSDELRLIYFEPVATNQWKLRPFSAVAVDHYIQHTHPRKKNPSQYSNWLQFVLVVNAPIFTIYYHSSNSLNRCQKNNFMWIYHRGETVYLNVYLCVHMNAKVKNCTEKTPKRQTFLNRINGTETLIFQICGSHHLVFFFSCSREINSHRSQYFFINFIYSFGQIIFFDTS